MYFICSLFALSFGILVFAMIFLKKRKSPYFHQVNDATSIAHTNDSLLIDCANQIESYDQPRPHSPPTPVQEKLCHIDIIEKKASGKFGDVHKAYDYDQKKIVAVKIIPAHVSTETVFRSALS